jgi:hypothetical protein
MESVMRTGVVGLVGAVLAAAPLCRAAEPPLPAVLSSTQAGTPPSAVSPSPPVAPAPPATLPEQLGPPVNPSVANNPGSQGSVQSPAAAACGDPAAKSVWHDCHCGPPEQFWLGGGYRAWWIKDQRITSTLVTTSPVPGGPSSILFGGEDIGYGTFSGITLDGGMWLNCRHTFGIELNGFYFGSQSVTETFAGSGAPGSPVIARPFTDVGFPNVATPSALIVATPGSPFVPGALLREAGAVSITTKSQLAGAGVNGVLNQLNTEDYTVDGYAGFRYIDLEERLTVAQTSTPVAGPLPPGFVTLPAPISLLDDFRTRNQFYGGLVGTRGEWRFGPLFVGGSTSIALGPNHEVLEINGRTTTGGTTQTGGLLSVGGGTAAVPGPTPPLPSAFVHLGNIGRYTTNRFIAVPEASAEIGVYVTSHIKVAVGYNFLYLTESLRPGRQIDTQINPALVPSSPQFGSGTLTGPPAPFVTGRREDFHAQGIQFTTEVRY